MTERAYSLLTVKADAEQRILRGLCTCPEPDRMLDIVEPLGLTWRGNSVPLLWQHAHDMPLCQARLDPPTSKGVTFEARLPKVAEPSPFRDRVEDAWASCVHGAVKGVSIGFRPLETEPLPSGGIRFKRAEIYEISLVSVPANAACTVQTIKAMAQRKSGVVYLNDPGPGKFRITKIHPLKRLADTSRPVATAVRSAIDRQAEEAERAATRKALGPMGAFTVDAMATIAKTTDAELADLRRRLDQLERGR